MAVAGLVALMILVIGKVMPIDEVYKAVEWKTIFLVAGLIPLVVASEKTGQQIMSHSIFYNSWMASPLCSSIWFWPFSHLFCHVCLQYRHHGPAGTSGHEYGVSNWC